MINRSNHDLRTVAVLALVWSVCLALGANSASAQLLVVEGGTPFSYQVFAQAAFIQASGQFLESAARARLTNSQAAEQEMKNSVTWVNTYFERRKLNREWRAAENPSWLEKEEKRQAQQRRLIESNSQTVMTGDVTGELNWMLRELMTRASSTLFMPGHPNSVLSGDLNHALEKYDAKHIRLTENCGGAGGKRLVFRADSAEVLETSWPLVWRDEAFAQGRAQFEQARDLAISELKSTQSLSHPSEVRLMKAVDNLSAELQQAFPQSRRTESPARFLEYTSAKRYLQTLADATFRLIDTRSDVAFDPTYKFSGASVGELIQHMMNRGLEFAPPEVGDESTYRKLYPMFRQIYLKEVPKSSSASTGK